MVRLSGPIDQLLNGIELFGGCAFRRKRLHDELRGRSIEGLCQQISHQLPLSL
jgi:hypothetical protein